MQDSDPGLADSLSPSGICIMAPQLPPEINRIYQIVRQRCTRGCRSRGAWRHTFLPLRPPGRKLFAAFIHTAIGTSE